MIAENMVIVGTMVVEVTMDTVGTLVANMVTVGTTEVPMVTSSTSKDKPLSALSL